MTPPAHNVTITVRDKYGAPVRNARVSPSSMSLDTPNGGACLRPNQQFPITGIDGVGAVGGWIPGRTGGLTGSTGQSLLATPGPLDSVLDFAVVTAEIKPGAVQRVTVAGTAIQGDDPFNRVAIAVLPYAPIMEDASTAGETPGEGAVAQMRTMSVGSAPEVLVRQPSGTVLPDTGVQLVRVIPGDSPETPAEGATVAYATTGADGKARFPGLDDGRYRAIPVNVTARTVDFTVTGALPPSSMPPAATVKAKATSGKSKLKVDVNPNKGSGYWKFQVQRKRSDGTWKPLKTYKTQGNKETRTINLPKGTYRVVVHAKYQYEGTTSAPVRLTR